MKRRPQLITGHLLTVSKHQRRRKLITCVRPAFQRQLMRIKKKKTKKIGILMLISHKIVHLQNARLQYLTLIKCNKIYII